MFVKKLVSLVCLLALVLVLGGCDCGIGIVGQKDCPKCEGAKCPECEKCPKQDPDMTRIDLIRDLVRYFGAPVTTANCTTSFPDVKKEDYCTLEFAEKRKWIAGYSNGLFGPADMVTWAQFAKLLADAYDIYARQVFSGPAVNSPPDTWFFGYMQQMLNTGAMGVVYAIEPNFPVPYAVGSVVISYLSVPILFEVVAKLFYQPPHNRGWAEMVSWLMRRDSKLPQYYFEWGKKAEISVVKQIWAAAFAEPFPITDDERKGKADLDLYELEQLVQKAATLRMRD